MEERRTLAYIKEEDIPSSAVLVTLDNYTTTYGNTLYVPIKFKNNGGYVNLSARSGSSTIKEIGPFKGSYYYIYNRSNDTYHSYNKICLGEIANNQYYVYPYFSYVNNSSESFSLCGPLVNNLYGSNSGYGPLSVKSSLSSSYFIDSDTIYYIRVKFSSDILIHYTSSSSLLNYYTFYLNEE